jgi:hypothetical protein
LRAPAHQPVYCGVDTTDLHPGHQADPVDRRWPGPSVGASSSGFEFFLAHGAPGVRYAFRRRCGRPASASFSTSSCMTSQHRRGRHPCRDRPGPDLHHHPCERRAATC